MNTKDSQLITDLLFNKTILDLEQYGSDSSEYLFFVKDTNSVPLGGYEDLNNKLTLIIVCKENGYVVNNNFKFNSLKIEDNKITIYRMVDNKRKESYYWLK
jgi:hypothetical protein